MVSACSHCRTSLQNLPGRDTGEREERREILVIREKQTALFFMLSNSQYFWGPVFEISGGKGSIVSWSTAGPGEAASQGQSQAGTHKTLTQPSQQILQLPRCFSSKCKAHWLFFHPSLPPPHPAVSVTTCPQLTC